MTITEESIDSTVHEISLCDSLYFCFLVLGLHLMTHLHTSVHVDHRVIVEQEKLLSVIFGCWGSIYKGSGMELHVWSVRERGLG